MSGGGSSGPVLLGDLGGTNVRFALARPGGDPECQATLRVADHADMAAAIRAYLAMQPEPSARTAALAVAAAVNGDEVRMTNNPWRFSRRRLMADAGLKALRVVNDFEAVALALPHLGPDDCVRIGGGEAVAGAPKAVLGPGTGLGVALAVPHGD
ncbi:MAG: glucokinase, partial [Proteobacteria bacterium]|nr:glucokinase [Pseudomonadota bacterium]